MFNNLKKHFGLLLLIAILVGGFAVRLYRFTGPIADWHSWRQADTSAVSRTFVEHGFDVLHPRFEDLSNVPSGLDNPEGYRFVEFPIYNVLQAALRVTFPVLTLEEWGRVVTILSSLGISLFLYLLLRRVVDEKTGIFAAFFYTFIPFSIYYGRTILPDTMMAMTILGGTYFFYLWIEGKTKINPSASLRAGDQNVKPLLKTQKYLIRSTLYFILATLFTAAAMLLKPYALFFTLPMIWLAFDRFGLRFIKKWQLWLFLVLSVLPLALWRVWMAQYPSGIPVSAWLFNGGNIRFKGAYFYWLFADRIARLILGYWGVSLLTAGALVVWGKQYKKTAWLLLSFLLSSLLYMVVIARGNVQHDYYQILIVPSLVIFVALGGKFLFDPPEGVFPPVIGRLALLVLTLFMLFFGWYFIRDYFNINNPAIVVAGQAVSQMTPSNAKIIAPYNGDTSFLYQTDRQGWASFEKPLPELIRMGADYLVLVNPRPEDRNIGKQYRIVSETPDYILFNLRQKP